MAIVLGFIHDGVLIAAAGESTAVALGELAEQLGPDVELAYANAVESIEAKLQGAEPPRAGATDVPAVEPAWEQDRGQGGQGVSVARPQDQPAVEAAPQAAPDDQTGGEGVRPGGPPQGEAPAPGPAGPACVVCDGDVPPVLAQISTQRFGDVRCRTCGDW